jgi:4-hydroxy-tetrahydrodipicolinate synthase
MAELVLQGTFTAIVTPLSPDGGAIDVEALDRLVEDQIEGGVSGLVPAVRRARRPR